MRAVEEFGVRAVRAGVLDGLQLLGESRPDLPSRMAAWPAEDGSVWLDGYASGAAPVRLFPIEEEGRIVGLSLDRQRPPRSAFPRVERVDDGL